MSIEEKVYYGHHLSIAKGYLNAIVGCGENVNCMQIFLQSPFGNRGKDKWTDSEALQIKEYVAKHDKKLFVHCSYFINLCKDYTTSNKYVTDMVIKDLKRGAKMGVLGCVIHVGKLNIKKEGKKTSEQGLLNFKKHLRRIINKVKDIPNIPMLLIETAAGQGTETPVSIKGLAQLYNSLDEEIKANIGFCIDTCHVFASGACDMRDETCINSFVSEWKELIGWDKVYLIHFNDSKCDYQSKKDRHAIMGKGKIGEKGLLYFKNICIKTNKPLVTEWKD